MQTIQNTLRPGRLTVVEYSERGESRDMLTRLIGGESTCFSEPLGDLNRSATDAALLHLQSIYHDGKTLDRSEWKDVILQYSGAMQDRGFTRFTREQKERLRTRYRCDLEQLNKMDGIKLIA